MPLDVATIYFFTAIFFATLLTVGEFARRLLNFVIKKKDDRKNSLIENLSIDLALATAIIPLFVMFLTFFGGLFNRFSIILFIFIAIFFYVYTSRNKISKLLKGPSEINHSLNKVILHCNANKFTILLCIALFTALIIRLHPTLGLFVYPADDAKMHTFLANLIADNNGYPQSFGKYISNTDQALSGVNYPLGFHAICAFFHFLSLIPIEGCVLLVTQIYSGLLTLSMFFFASKLFKREYAGFLSAIFFGLISRQPLFFFGWGGNAELVSNYLLLVLLGLHYETVSQDKYPVNVSVTCALLFAGILFIHELSFLYVICCIIPYIIYHSAIQRTIKPVVQTFLMISLAVLLNFLFLTRLVSIYFNTAKVEILSDPFYRMLKEWCYLGPEYILSTDWIDRIWHIVENWFGLPLIFFSLIGTIFLLIESYKNKDRLVVLIGWLLVLIAVHENGPYGFYFIEIPFWHLLLPNRFFLAMSMPLSCLAGYCLLKFGAMAEKTYSFLKLKKLKKNILFKFLWIILLVIVLVSQTYTNFITINDYKDRSAVTEQDYLAFMWIKENTFENATFYVNDADSGQWIPAIAKRRVLPVIVNPFLEGFVTEEYFSDMKTLSNILLTNPNEVLAVNLLKKYEINYIFIGEKSIFGRTQLNAILFLNSSHYNLLYHEEETQIYIFEALNS